MLQVKQQFLPPSLHQSFILRSEQIRRQVTATDHSVRTKKVAATHCGDTSQ